MIIVYGPKGCGKTTNAKDLAAFFECSNIIDSDTYQRGTTTTDTIAFIGGSTIWKILNEHTDLNNIAIIPFSLAMKLANLYDLKGTNT